MREQPFQNALMVALSKLDGVRVWRQPAGKILTNHKTAVQCAPVGACDITGIATPGIRLEVEVKGEDTPDTKQQQRWRKVMARMGAVVFLARYDSTQTMEQNVSMCTCMIEDLIESRRSNSCS